LGTDNGVRHYFVDTTAVNGYKYYYAVTSYDKGSIPIDPKTGRRSTTQQDSLKIDPSECAKFVAVHSSGEIEKGKNVVVVRPEAKAGGYVDPKLAGTGIISQPQNTADGSIKVVTVVGDNIKQNHTYQVTFKDSLNTNKLRATASYSVKDLTSNKQLVTDQPLPIASDEQYQLVSEAGIKLNFLNNPAALKVDSLASGFTRENTFYGWTGLKIPYLKFTTYTGYTKLNNYISADIEVIFSDLGIDSSKAYYRKPSATGTPLYLPPLKTNFTIINKKTGEKIPFALKTYSGKSKDVGSENLGRFSFQYKGKKTDEIIILSHGEDVPADSLLPGWQISYVVSTGSDTLKPKVGDHVTYKLTKPFLSNDVFEFTTLAGSLDANKQKEDMDKIRVVPNPYIVTNKWEPRNPYSDGRGDRVIHFTHLPSNCTIRIFNVKGQLIKTLQHDAQGAGSNEQVPQYNGTLSWNMLSEDNLEISYGIYIFHVDAPGIGEKIGKFLVIK
jgi:hypothetical protein